MTKRIVNYGLIGRVWNEFKDNERVKKDELKSVLENVIKSKRVGFIYTHRFNDVIKHGTMSGETYKIYEKIMEKLNYECVYWDQDTKYTKEIYTGWDPVKPKEINAIKYSKWRVLSKALQDLNEIRELPAPITQAPRKEVKRLINKFINRYIEYLDIYGGPWACLSNFVFSARRELYYRSSWRDINRYHKYIDAAIEVASINKKAPIDKAKWRRVAYNIEWN